MQLKMNQKIYSPFSDSIFTVIMIDWANREAYCEKTFLHTWENTGEPEFRWCPFWMLEECYDIELLYKERLLNIPYNKNEKVIRPFENGPGLPLEPKEIKCGIKTSGESSI